MNVSMKNRVFKFFYKQFSLGREKRFEKSGSYISAKENVVYFSLIYLNHELKIKIMA